MAVIVMLAAANGFAILYIILPFFNKNRKSVHDCAAGTIVSKKEKPHDSQ
ncbi:RDD family protein [Metabacillus sp. KIGAM252]|uniref:RDD family protein n=1 Tax=Metabacillus flavus TaxID=2823519 RepID=A0ABS5LBL9_9BACI|nr:RDD family protein [Metabacillus flavus]MBS2968117.1 RDD family protein [Metabacillus flavus]